MLLLVSVTVFTPHGRHGLFTKTGVDIFALYSGPAPAFNKGSHGPTPDAKWARRQHSHIWAPELEQYEL